MKISEIKNKLSQIDELVFKLPNGDTVPKHFHVTEVGMITKHFIDCGGTERIEKVINFQLWEAGDYDHRLAPSKLINIISLSESKLGFGDLEVEVEYQQATIGKFGLDFKNGEFVLTNKNTNCLALDLCGITDKVKFDLSSLSAKVDGCKPGSGCC
jgi:hypothetical protein